MASSPPTTTNLRQNRCKAETRETLHRRTRSPGRSHKSPSALRLAANFRIPGSPGRLVSCDGVNKNNYDALITALIAAELVSGGGLTAPTAPTLRRWSPETSGARSDPVLLSSVGGGGGLKRAHGRAKCVYSRLKHSSNAIFRVCDVGQSAFHRLSNAVEAVASWQGQKESGSNPHRRYSGSFPHLPTDEAPRMLKY